ncbi:MAG: CocE/NonD family hydrolase [Anaerolineales bacterium]|nr:CocE/NonD family hydrolase [Anaerolineales bacterium]
MKIRTQFPHTVTILENVWIPLADGTRLAAKIWLPDSAQQQPVPALLEYIPYRKSDYTSGRDAKRQAYFAGYGYANVRVDMRGSGDSDGILYDEYLLQEQDDALEVLAWIAAQPWCDGNIGMHGISWGGFNSLQVAARRPPELKAIIAIGATDDRYHDDVHYMGGCLLTSQMLPWASLMFAYNPSPPDPRWVGEKWREMWLERLEQSPPYIEKWLEHQTLDAYWKHGSVRENYADIEIPVYMVGGWADSYNNSIPRLMAGLNVPRKALIGPWSHAFPEQCGTPGPAIGFLQESLRWWDYWLKGIDTGIMDEPMIRCWLQDGVPPAPNYKVRNGRWLTEPSWPSPNIQEKIYFLNENRLDDAPQPMQEISFVGLQNHGLDGGGWGGHGSPGESPGDQRPADGESLTFTSQPLAEPINLLGNAEVQLTLKVDQPLALVAVRLCDVDEDGRSTLVTWGLLNLTHRNSHENPEPLVPGQVYTVTVPLNVMAYRLPAGHRWRVGISPTYLRHAWPSPQPVTLTLLLGKGCKLSVPERPFQPHDDMLPDFPPAEIAPPEPIETLRHELRRQTVTREATTGTTTFTLHQNSGRIRYKNHGLELDDMSTHTLTIRDDAPLSLEQTVTFRLEYKREDWQVVMKTESKLTADATFFYLSNFLEAYEGDVRVFSKAWTKRVARNGV